MTDTTRKLLIAIPTELRRSTLVDSLRSLERLEVPRGCEIEILVVENGDRQRFQVQDHVPARFPIHHVLESRPGLAHVRNRVLEEAVGRGADYLAGLDDDEVADPHWLVNHHSAMERFGADVCTGPVSPAYMVSPPDWIVRGKFFRTGMHRETGALLQRAAAGNFFMNLNQVRQHPVMHDPRFNFTGSEDTDYFQSLARHGARIIWVADALIRESVPQERLNLAYLKTRDFRIGIGRALRARKQSLLHLVMLVLLSLPKGLFYGLMGILPLSMHRRNKAICKFMKQRGIVRGAFGGPFAAYGPRSSPPVMDDDTRRAGRGGP